MIRPAAEPQSATVLHPGPRGKDTVVEKKATKPLADSYSWGLLDFGEALILSWIGGAMKHEGDSRRPKGCNDACPCPDCQLPPQGPPAYLREKAVAIWCGTYYAELATEMGQDAAEECASAFAYGFEKGVTTAMLRPEWAQALYLKLREYYLLTHAPADLAVWEAEAEETCRAIPVKAEVPPAGECSAVNREEPSGHRHS